MPKPVAFQVQVAEPYESAVDRVIAALKVEGFGVLTRIDVKATLKEKLDAEFRPYVILGACNPPLAHRALLAHSVVGVMLPCNVTVEEWEEGARVSIANPAAMFAIEGLGEQDSLQEVVMEARSRLLRVAQSLES